jgi:lipoate-protein ligase B
VSELAWHWLGRLPYADGVAEQVRRRDRLLGGDGGAAGVLLLEHEPVITLGRRADATHLLASPGELAGRGIAVTRTDRGGDVTYHGPGQLMVYPIIRLRGSLLAFLRATAEALARTAAAFGVAGAEWRCNPAGLWLGERKLAACGVHMHRRTTSHGFALNVATPAEMWALIVPCGLSGVGVTSLAEARPGPAPEVAAVAAVAGPHLCAALQSQHLAAH